MSIIRIIAVLAICLLTSCTKEYVITKPMSANKMTYYYITYEVKYTSGDNGTVQLQVSEEVYSAYVNTDTDK